MFRLTLQNRGTQPLTVNGGTPGPEISLTTSLPLQIPPMSTRDLTFVGMFHKEGNGHGFDHSRLGRPSERFPNGHDPRARQRLLSHSRRPGFPRLPRDRHLVVQRRPGLRDEQSLHLPGPGASATFSTVLREAGMYEVSAIVPTTVNASIRARYLLITGGTGADSVFRDQNQGSGTWVSLFRRIVPAGSAGLRRRDRRNVAGPVRKGPARGCHPVRLGLLGGLLRGIRNRRDPRADLPRPELPEPIQSDHDGRLPAFRNRSGEPCRVRPPGPRSDGPGGRGEDSRDVSPPVRRAETGDRIAAQRHVFPPAQDLRDNVDQTHAPDPLRRSEGRSPSDTLDDPIHRSPHTG